MFSCVVPEYAARICSRFRTDFKRINKDVFRFLGHTLGVSLGAVELMKF